MRLLSLDYDPVYGDDSTRSTFGDDTSTFDYDVVIWDPAASLGTYTRAYMEYYQNLPVLSDNESVAIRADVRRRRAEFSEYINSGRALVVVGRPPQQCNVDTGERSYSGTGRNRVTTRHVAPLDLLSALPVPHTTSFSRAKGGRIGLDGDGPLVSLLRKYKHLLSYDAVITDPPGSVLAHVAGTSRVVSFVQRSKSGGYLILLPVIDLGGHYPEEDSGAEEQADDSTDDEYGSWGEQAPEFQEDLLSAIEQLQGSKVSSRPAWADRYATAEQQTLRDELLQQQSKIEAARERLAMLQQARDAAESRDQLFLGTGRALVLEVRDVFSLLGGVVTEPEPGRDDLRVTFPEGTAVVEVKGVSKSAAEKHAAQLEKWVAGALEETGAAPKGILVVNTWRETPLARRNAEDFPKQMLSYSKSRGHCLVTGLQLYVIRADIERDPARVIHWRRKLLATVGPLTGVGDWRGVIRETHSEGPGSTP